MQIGCIILRWREGWEKPIIIAKEKTEGENTGRRKH